MGFFAVLNGIVRRVRGSGRSRQDARQGFLAGFEVGYPMDVIVDESAGSSR